MDFHISYSGQCRGKAAGASSSNAIAPAASGRQSAALEPRAYRTISDGRSCSGSRSCLPREQSISLMMAVSNLQSFVARFITSRGEFSNSCRRRRKKLFRIGHKEFFNNNLRSKNNIDYTIDVVISHQTFDFSFSHNAKIAVSIRQCQTEAIRGTLQPAVIIALPTNADSLLQVNELCFKPLEFFK